MEKYAVLLSEEVPVPVTEIAVPLAELLDRTPAEVTHGLRESPWILLADVPATRLDEVFAILAAARVPAKAVPEAWLPPMPPALRVTVADTVEKGLFLTNAEPPAPPIFPWRGIDLVSAGLVDGPAGEHLLVDLVGTEEYPLRLRIDAAEFSHEYLGDRMRPSSRENLRLFLEDLGEMAPGARFTAKTESFRKGEPTIAYRFPSVRAFEDYTRWVLQALTEEEEAVSP